MKSNHSPEIPSWSVVATMGVFAFIFSSIAELWFMAGFLKAAKGV